MSDSHYSATPVITAVPEAAPLTQMQRVVYTFTAPSKTFNDIKRSTSWWLPWVISIVFSYGLFAAINAKVGWTQIAETNMKRSPKQAEQIDKLPPEQRASQMKIVAISTEAVMAATPLLAIVFVAVIAGVLLATINFGFGGKAKFWEAFAVSMYAGLPGIFKLLLATIALFAGLDAESFNLNNPSGTNIGYFLPPDTAKPLMTLATSIDIITIWTLALTAIGLAIVARTKASAGYIAVFGWWLVLILIGAGWAAVMG